MKKFLFWVLFLVSNTLLVSSAFAEVAAQIAPVQAAQAQAAQIKPYKTFVTIQGYTVENNGEVSNPISDVRLEIQFPDGSEEGAKYQWPQGGQFVQIANGLTKNIDQTYEIPWENIQNDGFKFKVQMVRKGTKFLPCEFDVAQLSQFNRAYICRTDVQWQTNNHTPDTELDKEAVQVRVFTDRNSTAKELAVVKPTAVLWKKPVR